MAGSFINLQDFEISNVSSWSTPIKALGALLFGLLILLLLYRVFYLPTLNSNDTEKFKEQTLKREFEQKQALAANLPEHKVQMVEVRGRFDTLLQQLPDKNEVPQLLADISRAGAEQGIEFVLFKPSPPEQQKFFVRLPIEIEASGTYHQIARFITTIANFRRVVSVGDFTITRNTVGRETLDSHTLLSIKASIYTYHFNNTEALEDEQTTLDAAPGTR